jgi:mRNA-degrading endonuclease RelE of RelBE toxin-antitoxin system
MSRLLGCRISESTFPKAPRQRLLALWKESSRKRNCFAAIHDLVDNFSVSLKERFAKFSFGRYRILYEFAECDNAVYVLAVIHSSMDIDRLRL